MAESGEWENQIQVVSDVSAVWSQKLKNGCKRLLCQGGWSQDDNELYQSLADYWAKEAKLPDNIGVNLLDHGDISAMRLKHELFEKADKHPEFAEAARAIRQRIDEFRTVGGRGALVRLRLQGGRHENGDSIFHDDGAGLLGQRMAGPKTQEVHSDDVMKVSNSNATVIDDCRVFEPEMGDVWGHRANYNPFKSSDRAVHKKGASTGEVGLILTMQ